MYRELVAGVLVLAMQIMVICSQQNIIMNVGYKDVDKGAETISGSTEAVRVKSMGVVIILT